MMRPAKFNRKAFFSFMVVFAWLILILTGIVLYFSPPGRVANWVIWRFMGLTKTGWQAVHTVFALAFIIVGAFHLYYNWIVFWSYLKSKLQAGIKMKQELALSSFLTVTILVLMILQVPPFQTVMDFGEYLSNSWSNPSSEPPIPHAELLTLSQYAQKTGTNMENLLQSLKHEGIQHVDSTTTIEELAEMNNTSPSELIQRVSDNDAKKTLYTGYGRKTVEEVAAELGIPVQVTLKRLDNHKIIYNKDEFIKDIAEQNDILPVDIISVIKGEKISSEE